MMAVEIVCRRAGDTDIPKASDTAQGIENRGRHRTNGHPFQEDRIKRDHADKDSFRVQAVTLLTVRK